MLSKLNFFLLVVVEWQGACLDENGSFVGTLPYKYHGKIKDRAACLRLCKQEKGVTGCWHSSHDGMCKSYKGEVSIIKGRGSNKYWRCWKLTSLD